MENSTRMILWIAFQTVVILAMLTYVVLAVTGN